MGIFEDAINKTKDLFEVARVKTDEVVTTEKQKFKISSLKSKRDKDFTALGRIYFEKIKNNDDLDENVSVLVKSITEKNEEICRLNEELQTIKNKYVCTNCGAGVEKNSAYCNSCGTKLG